MLVDPADDEPRAFIAYREEMAFPIDDDPRAHATIEMLGLNREELAEFRFDHLAPFRGLRERAAVVAGGQR